MIAIVVAGAATLLPPQLATALTSDAIRPFRVNIPEEQLVDLRRRIAATRWPDRETVGDRSQGTQLAKMQELVRHWARITIGERPKPGSTPCPSS